MEIVTAISENKKSVVKAMTTSESIVSFAGESITIDEVFIFDKDGTQVMVIHDKSGDYISSTSKTVLESITAILSVTTTEEILHGVAVNICKKMSNNKREFFYLELA